MTDNLLEKLEEKMMSLLTELDGARRECQQLKQENSALKNEQANRSNKIRELLSLVDALDIPEAPVAAFKESVAIKRTEESSIA